jgi:hypothetical protein
VYSNPDVADFITRTFLPVRVHVREQRDEFQRLGKRFNAQWTPTILIVDDTGAERHRVEGFLPADDFSSQLALGLGHAAFAAGDFAAAEPYFREVVDRYPNTEAAPEALYWAGVSHYKATNDANALGETAKAFDQRYKDSSWAKKASVWKNH